jgi:GntR family transcriptional regulator
VAAVGPAGERIRQVVIITVDPRSHVPPYEQVCGQIRDLVRSKALPPGHRMPPVRRLAGDLGLAPNTVARAYRQLESEDVLEGRGSRGTFVTVIAEETSSPQAAAREYVIRASRSGWDRDAAIALVAAIWDAAEADAPA